jgi:ABC-2 type transport system ATP-binding protein
MGEGFMLELRNVKKYYGSKAVGLMNESVVINSGEVVGILGENGAGKSTLLRAVMGLAELNSGEVLIDGKAPRDRYEDMSFISHESSFFPQLTPYQYGEFLAEYCKRFNHERYEKLLKFFEIEPYTRIKNFSYGQKAKLEISAGFSKMAKYIVMDEPFLGEDILTRQDFIKLMASSIKEDETILISTHHINEIENFIDRALILRYGRIKADIYMDDLKAQGKTLPQLIMELSNYKENKYKGILD